MARPPSYREALVRVALPERSRLKLAHGVRRRAPRPTGAWVDARIAEAEAQTQEAFDARIQEVARLSAEGLSVRQIGKRMNLGKSTVARDLAKIRQAGTG